MVSEIKHIIGLLCLLWIGCILARDGVNEASTNLGKAFIFGAVVGLLV